MRKQTKEGDDKGAITYLMAKQDAEPLCFYNYNLDEDNNLSHLFWADSKSRIDYELFGDILVFDTTYKTNAYRKPLVVLVGINNHHYMCVCMCSSDG